MTETRNSSPPVQSRRLLEHCRQQTMSFAGTQLTELLANAGAALLDFAERAQSNAVQGRFFEAMNELQRHRADVENAFRRQIQAGFTHFCETIASPGEYESEKGNTGDVELTLVSPEEIEESVAAENLTIKAKTACAPELNALNLRLAMLTGRRRLKANQMPAGPHHIVDAYRTALAGLDIEIKAKIVLYALFDKFIIKQAKPFYQGLNSDLAKAGVLPDLKPLSSQSGQHDLPTRPNPRTRQASDTQPALQENVDTSLGTELFDSIVELMSATRRAHHGTRSGGNPQHRLGESPQVSPQVQAATRETLVTAIDRIQARTPPKAVAAVGGGGSKFPNIEVDDGLVDRMKHLLHQERKQILLQVDNDKLAPMDGNLIDLIGMLFEFMLKDPILPNSAKALLSRLHTPYLKLALIDQRLLVESNHPARRLLDKMVEAGGIWIDGQNPTRGIFPAMTTIVDRIIREFKKDIALFDELLLSFEHSMAEQQRRTSTMEQRTQEAARGREKLFLAKQHATQQVRRLTQRHALPEAVSNFLSKTWLDDLVFVLLRDQHGENGEEWKRAVDTAGQLVGLFEPGIADAERAVRMQTVPEIRDEISLRVQRMGNYSRTAVDTLFALLDDPQSWHPDNVRAADTVQGYSTKWHTEPTDLAGGQDTVDADDTGPTSGPTAAESTMIERLSKIRPGTWFEFTPIEGGQAKRVKLSWISPLTSSCMFVDKSGIQAETRTLRSLAQEILSGHSRIVPRPRSPFIDRALISIRKLLQRDKGEEISSLEA